MQTKERIIIRHVSGLYLNRRASGLTDDLDAALRFPNMGEASEWLLNSYYAPKDAENYGYATVEITIRLKEVDKHEREHEDLRKSS